MDIKGDVYFDELTRRAYGRIVFPPDPSASDYAVLGVMVANNSGGEHSLLYGTTKNYTKNLTVVTADGEKAVVTRDEAAPVKYGSKVKDTLQEASSVLNKLKPLSFRNSCGHNLLEALKNDSEVNFKRLFYGSEGTLGIITETVDLDVRERLLVLTVSSQLH